MAHLFKSVYKYKPCTVITPSIPAVGRQRQVDLGKSEASLAYRVSFRTARATHTNHPQKPKPKTNRVQKAVAQPPPPASLFVALILTPATCSLHYRHLGGFEYAT